MKRQVLSGVLLLTVAVVACSTLTTSFDYDKKANFSSYKTFAIRDDGSIKNPLLAKRLESVLFEELSRRGLSPAGQNPDLWVVAHARLSKEMQINTYSSGWGYGWGWGGYGGMTTSTVTEIPVGTLIVDLVDAKQKELVWRGTASDTLDPKATPDEKEKRIREAVAKMLESYPPR